MLSQEPVKALAVSPESGGSAEAGPGQIIILSGRTWRGQPRWYNLTLNSGKMPIPGLITQIRLPKIPGERVDEGGVVLIWPVSGQKQAPGPEVSAD
jgi:hypothetical protein